IFQDELQKNLQKNSDIQKSEPETITFENENDVNGKDPSACNGTENSSRDGRAVRLSYDHKGSDPQVAKRIVEAGGFVMNNRVNDVLAVTRSLGDCSMKEFVI
ncbi:11586_t:CDS:2, partial [Dentiscutata erythropus]